MEAPTITHVYAAIDTLYHSSKVEGKEDASAWLEQFQKSLYAWEISDQLLRQNRDQESQYFAAQTMKTKIQHHFAELPQQQHLNLRNSLIDHLLQYSLASHATLTQLCLALADLSIQSPQWVDPVTDLISKFSTKLEHFSILLEILMMLPEEIENESLHIGLNRRNEVIEQYKMSSHLVLDLMLKCHEVCPTDDRTQCKLYQCFGTWLTLGSFPPHVVADSKLLKLAFENLLSPKTSEKLHDAITDCICHAIYTSGDIYNQGPLTDACFNFVTNMIPKEFAKSAHEDDKDKLINYARIYAELGDALLEPILTSPGEGPGSLRTLDLILSCVEQTDHEVAAISFNFWYRFGECIDTNVAKEQREIFKPYVQRLILQLCQLVQFEDSLEGVPDKNDDAQDFRFRALDVIEDVVFVVGSAECFRQIFQSFQQQNLQWNKLEARLFCMYPMTRFVKVADDTPGFVLQMLFDVTPKMHIMVQHTSIVLLGDLSEWIANHKQFVDSSFQYILNGLQHKDLAQMAAFALSKFCTACSSLMNKMFPVLLEVSKAVDSLNVDNEGVTGILTGCALVLSNMPIEVVPDGLMHLCTPHVQPLYEIIQSGGHGTPVKYLDRLAAVFRDIKVQTSGEHPCKKVLVQLWDMFKMIVNKYKADGFVMERLFRCIRFGIRCLGQDFVGLMQNLIELIVNLYNEHQHSCVLYVGSILTDEYGDNKEAEAAIMQMLKSFVPPTFRILSQEKGLINHPDTVDDFFRLCIRLLQRCTLAFLKVESLDSIIQLAIAGTTLDHRDGNMSVMKFLNGLIKCAYIEKSHPCFGETKERLQLLHNILSKYGQDIMNGLVAATAGGIQMYMVPEIADVVWEMMEFDKQATMNWFKVSLSNLPSHNSSGVIYATPQQIESFYNTVVSSTTIKILWKEFREFSKYFK